MVSLAQTALFGVAGSDRREALVDAGWNPWSRRRWLGILACHRRRRSSSAPVASGSEGIYFLIITLAFGVTLLLLRRRYRRSAPTRASTACARRSCSATRSATRRACTTRRSSASSRLCAALRLPDGVRARAAGRARRPACGWPRSATTCGCTARSASPTARARGGRRRRAVGLVETRISAGSIFARHRDPGAHRGGHRRAEPARGRLGRRAAYTCCDTYLRGWTDRFATWLGVVSWRSSSSSAPSGLHVGLGSACGVDWPPPRRPYWRRPPRRPRSPSPPEGRRYERRVLRVRGLTRRFGGVVAVDDVDLDIAPGERRAVLGPNGAGKSTLFNLIAGADTPTSGTIELFGRDVTRLRRPAAHADGAVAGPSRPPAC